jgi:flagellar motor switch protein FliM
MMLVLGVTAWVGGEIMDEMQLAFPHYTLEPLINKLSAKSKGDEALAERPAERPKWNPALDDLEIPVTVELPPAPFSTRRLAELKVGDFIQLQPDATGRVVVRLGGLAKFVGELGAQNDCRAVRINAAQKSKKLPRAL